MKLVAGFVAILAILSAWTVLQPRDTRSRAEQSANDVARSDEQRRAVLVELFTSEGCSSCPPADRLLADLERNQPVPGAEIIPMSEHVDYWNRLGWTDPFSSSLFSARQSDYARSFASEGAYTPQMVVDGIYEFVGSDRAKALEAIAGAAAGSKARVVIDRDAATTGSTQGDLNLSVRVDNLNGVERGTASEVMLAITEGGLHSSVSRGENAGSKLLHTAVVRLIRSIGRIKSHEGGFSGGSDVRLDPRWKRGNLRAVAFVQETRSRRVLGAGVRSLAE